MADVRHERKDQPSGRTLLAIDTATDQASVAFFDGRAITACSWPGSRRQTISVMPVIERLLDLADSSMADVGAIAVAIGPGSFTGLRVGLSIAKGLATLDDRAIIGIPTLDLVAHAAVQLGVDCHAVIPAGRSRVVWATYRREEATEPANATFAEFLAVVRDSQHLPVIGELTDQQRAELEAMGGHLLPVAFGSRAHALADLGWRRWLAGDVDDPITLEPRYLHGRPNPR